MLTQNTLNLWNNNLNLKGINLFKVNPVAAQGFSFCIGKVPNGFVMDT